MDFRAFKNTRRGLWVGRGLVSVGIVAMLVCVYFNARHGWSLGSIFYDQVALATMHGLVDIATALLVSGGAILFAWHMRKMGFVACLFALVLTSFSVLSVSGFMSVRIAGLESQKATLDALEKHGKWTGGTAYSRAGFRERRSLRLEMRQNLKEMVKVASMVPDSHAVIVANMTGWNLEFVQRLLIMISSGMAQVIKYICLLVGFWVISNRDERASDTGNSVRSDTGNSGSGGGSKGEDATHQSSATVTPLRPAQHAAPAQQPATQQRCIVPSVAVSTDAPTGKLTPEQMQDYLSRLQAVDEAQRPSWRAIGAATGWDHTTVFRKAQRVAGRHRNKAGTANRRLQHRYGGSVSMLG